MSEKRQQGVQSVEIGLGLARALARHGPAMSLKDLAAAARMAPAKAHRYLVSLIRAGIVDQEPASGKYRLGPAAIEIGMAALSTADVLRSGAEIILELRDAIDETVFIALWSERGPVIVRWEESSRPVAVNVRPGSIMPLVRSATGRIFAAFMPEKIVKPMIDDELAAKPALEDNWDKVLAATRRTGIGRVEGQMMAGVSGLAAPVFDHQGKLVAAVASMGTDRNFDARLDGKIVPALRSAAEELSRRLGYAG